MDDSGELSLATSDLQPDPVQDDKLQSLSKEHKKRVRLSDEPSTASDNDKASGNDEQVVARPSSPVEPPTKRQRSNKQTAALSKDAPVRRSARLNTPSNTAQPATKKATRARRQPTPAAAATISKETYEVERIVDSEIDADSKVHHYKVRWKGYSSAHDTWETKRNLAKCRAAIAAYEKKQSQKKK